MLSEAEDRLMRMYMCVRFNFAPNQMESDVFLALQKRLRFQGRMIYLLRSAVRMSEMELKSHFRGFPICRCM